MLVEVAPVAVLALASEDEVVADAELEAASSLDVAPPAVAVVVGVEPPSPAAMPPPPPPVAMEELATMPLPVGGLEELPHATSAT